MIRGASRGRFRGDSRYRVVPRTARVVGVLIQPAVSTAPTLSRAATRRAGIAGAVAVAAASGTVGLVVALHVLAWRRIDAVGRTISDYALVPTGRALFTAATGCLLLAAVALWWGLRGTGAFTPKRERADAWLTVLASLWCLGLLLAAGCVTDPPGAPLTIPGAVHRYASGVVFFAAPVIARLLAVRLTAAGGGLSSAGRRLSVLSALSWWCLALFLLSHLPVVLPHTALASLLAGPHAVLGLAERLLLAVDVAMLLVPGCALLSRHARFAARARFATRSRYGEDAR